MLYLLIVDVHKADMLDDSPALYEARAADASMCAPSPDMCPERRLRSRLPKPSAAVD
jgi:hypothetical protein